MDYSLFLFSFSLGIITFFSPCAFPMLPGYISYYLGIDSEYNIKNYISKKEKLYSFLKNGIIGGIVCASGALLVIVSIGICISFFGDLIRETIKENLFQLNLFVGIILIILGLIMVFNIKINFNFKIKNAPIRKGYYGIFFYGILYSLVSISCVIPLFLGVMIRAINTSNIIEGIIIFLTYAFGLCLFLIIITIIISIAKIAIIKKINKMLPLIQKIGSLILIIIGIWLIYNYSKFIVI
jgi:cytochrome c-type biogenesis protein